MGYLPQGLVEGPCVTFQGLGHPKPFFRGFEEPPSAVPRILSPGEKTFAFQGGKGFAYRGWGKGQELGQGHYPVGPFGEVEEKLGLEGGEAQAVCPSGEEGPLRLG